MKNVDEHAGCVDGVGYVGGGYIVEEGRARPSAKRA
jgi:hypothetical protein